MKVEFNRETVKEEMFCNITVGECFVVDLGTPDQIICMKTFGDGVDGSAVDLQGGEVLFFEDAERVVPLEADLKVRLGG